MQITAAPTALPRTDSPFPAPATREEAAKALIAVPAGIAMVATMTAMNKSMAGEAASRADLVQGLLEQLSPETASAALTAAIDGALGVAPELLDRADALRQAADGVVALYRDAASDHTKGDASQTLERLMTPFAEIAAPIFEAAALLDPSIVEQTPLPRA